MSSPTGMGGRAIDPRQTEPHYPAGNASAGILPAFPKAQPHFGGLADTAGSLISKVQVPSTLQDAFLFTAKEGPEAVYPLEGAVLAGRTHSAYKRDGWMEVQERVFEELAAAFIWLQGVRKLQGGFRSITQKTAPQFNHLNPDIAWNLPWSKPTHVDLTAQELFTKNHSETSQLLKLKSARWVFSVGLALGGVAYAVPTVNQWKTRLIMKYMHSRRKRSQEGDNVQFGDPRLQRTAPSGQTPGGFGQTAIAGAGSSPSTASHSSFKTPIQSFRNASFQASASQSPTAALTSGNRLANLGVGNGKRWPFQPIQGKSVQFGGLPGGSLVQGLGHMVDQTPYGSILVVDAGIAGGRSYVASKRSAFETVEVLVRDVGSLYFYILSVPHIMNLLTKALDKGFQTSSHLEPRVAERLHGEITKQLQGKVATLENVKNILHGSQAEGLTWPEGWLKDGMRQAKGDELAALLEKEAKVILGDTGPAANLLAAVKAKGHVTPQTVQHWLEDLQSGRGIAQGVEEKARKNLAVALKQAYRHSAGIRIEGLLDAAKLQIGNEPLETHTRFTNALKTMGAEAATGYKKRLQRMAQVDGLDQAHSMLRRAINILRDKNHVGHDSLFKQADAVADWLDNAKNRGLSLNSLIEEELGELKTQVGKLKIQHGLPEFAKGTQIGHLTALKNKLSTQKRWAAKAPKERLEKLMGLFDLQAGQPLLENARENALRVMNQLTDLAKGAEHSLLEDYRSRFQPLLKGEEGRLFSLAIDAEDAQLRNKLTEMQKGGLHHDTAFLRKAQSIVSQFTPDSREFANADKSAKMRTAIQHYGDALLQRLRDVGESASSSQAKDKLAQEMQSFLSLNRNLNYASRSVALVGTMFCLGWLVPHVQTTITKRLTGKDKNPGIASAATALGYGAPEPKAVVESFQSQSKNAKPVQSKPFNGVFVGQHPVLKFPQLGQNTYQN